ncbi:MAG: prephenate dehydratase [Xanthomonadales bacterium]|nr:prephenate dehydratase [Xanthomonadales bacterium]MCB1640339.1 prephenate dehydratase [Xanthomonadales bacterium]
MAFSRSASSDSKTNMTDAKPQDLAQLRGRIDDIDRQIQSLITERAGFARQVGLAKGPLAAALDYYRPERESQVLRSVIDRNEGPLSNAELVRVFREIMSACLAQQSPLRIAFLGPEGTFSQSAVLKHFGHSVRALPLGTLDEVFQEVEAGNADFGVVPVENSSEGAVHHTLDLFPLTRLNICGEVELRIHHNLLSHATDLGSIERVYSHAQSLAQCRGWLRAHLPQAERIAVSSNAEAARRARNAPEAAAIAGEAAAQVYSLPMLAESIEDQADNTTRFLVIGRELMPATGHDKTSLMLSGGGARPGALYKLLDPFARHRINMTRIESRPSRSGKWEYVFFIDIEGHVDDALVRQALADLDPLDGDVRVLGAYPVALL